MKKYFIVFLATLFLVINNISIMAARPKERSLDIYLNNFNQDIEEYYIDILIKDESCEKNFQNEKEQIISQLNLDGYIGAYTCKKINKTNTTSEKHRDLHRFTGEIPREFKVVIVDKNNEVIISELINIEAYNSVIYYNVLDNKIKIQNHYFNIFALFFFGFALMIMVKLITMYFLKLDFNQNLKLFLVVNFIGISLISIIVSMSNYMDGFIFAYKSLILMGLVFMIIESIVFTLFSKTKAFGKNILYGVLANVAGMIVFALCLLFTV